MDYGLWTKDCGLWTRSVVVLGGITNSLNCLFIKRSISIPNGFILFETEVRRLASHTDSCFDLRRHAPGHSEGLIATDENLRTRVADASEGAPHTHLDDESEEGGLFEDLAEICLLVSGISKKTATAGGS